MDQVLFPPTRAAGLAQLARFQASTGRVYSGRRNYDFGPSDRSNVSMLSPYLRTRLLTEEEVIRAALQRFSLSTAEKFIQEVCWRTYWKGWLEHRPQVWEDYCAERDKAYAALEKDGALASDVAAATQGNTGIAVFDAWMHELAQTGYLHNHARMWVSSIWIFTLKLPWVLGADHFLQHLSDGDPASNTLSWRWTAGRQTQGKTYLARASNIEKYAGDRFAREIGPHWREGLDRLSPDAAPLAGALPPNPVLPKQAADIPTEPFVLLLTEDDLHPLSLLPDSAKPVAIAAMARPNLRSPKGAAEPARAFTQNAVLQSLASAGADLGCSATIFNESESLSDQMIDFAAQNKVSTIVMAQSPVGWMRPVIDGLARDVEAQGLQLIELRRDWDTQFWPHATKGFFKLKKAIPNVLSRLGIVD